ncbi:MAG: hypothetical protein LBU00_00760 [Treponema sp.]|jgi:hypothetical protein|nr:hypothetical protein [Treponema sp.]
MTLGFLEKKLKKFGACLGGSRNAPVKIGECQPPQGPRRSCSRTEVIGACSKTRLVLDKLFETPVKSPVFLLNLRKLFQKLKFWNSLL